MLGLTQEALGALIGVTYQQVLKYEKGIDRIAAGRLHQLARALHVEVGYFFEGAESECDVQLNSQQRILLELTRNFVALPSRRHQEAVCMLVRSLADVEMTLETETAIGPEAAP
jgi:transcriptional regulator with XRE-family HTH domain